MSPFSAWATTTGTGGGVLGGWFLPASILRHTIADAIPTMSARLSQASQWRERLVEVDFEELSVELTPSAGLGGGEWLVSLMRRRGSQTRRSGCCKLGSGQGQSFLSLQRRLVGLQFEEGGPAGTDCVAGC